MVLCKKQKRNEKIRENHQYTSEHLLCPLLGQYDEKISNIVIILIIIPL